MMEIAFEAGFETPNGFNKAFKKIFNTSPTEYKNIRLDLLHSYKNKMTQVPKIVERKTTYVIYVREIGGYAKSSKMAWKKLIEKLNDRNKGYKEKSIQIKLEQQDAEMIGICHDDPSITSEENIRYDASLAWTKKESDVLSKEGFNTKKISSGKYAMVLHKGSYSKIVDSWMALYLWCEENKYIFRDCPPFEKYLNSPEDVEEQELLTEIYIPITMDKKG